MKSKNLYQLKRWLKRSAFVRFTLSKLTVLFREVLFIGYIVRSGRLFVYQKNLVSSRQLKNQKIITYDLDLPPFRDYQDLVAWLKNQSIQFQEGGFCVYIPPQEKAQNLFGAVLSPYPPNSGLKILKDLKPPSDAIYCATDVNPASPRLSDWIGYRPWDFLRVANYLYEQGLGPRIYDLVGVQTPHNSLTAYVIQHVAGRVPSEVECTAFLENIGRLTEKDQLIPMITEWRKAEDFLPPSCKGNLILDEATGKALYVDFQGFMLKDSAQYIRQVADEVRETVHFGNKHWIRGGKYLYQSIPGLSLGKRDINTRWNLFKEALQRQGALIDRATVFDIGCNAGMIMYSALIDGAAWAVGWDRPTVAKGAQKLLLSLGVTRFDIYGEDISSDPGFHFPLPQNIGSGKNSILFYLSMRKHIGFPDSVCKLPFKYMVYEDHFGVSLDEARNNLKEVVDRWGLQIDEISSYRDGDGNEEHVFAILHRK